MLIVEVSSTGHEREPTFWFGIRDSDALTNSIASARLRLSERVEADADLRRHYGLTPAEARVASGLAAGATLKEIAGLQEMSYETVRLHLKRVFVKTGTNRQADLVQLLMRTPPIP